MRDFEDEVKRLRKQLARCKQQRNEFMRLKPGFKRIKQEMIKKMDDELDAIGAIDIPEERHDFVIEFGTEYKGKRISEIPQMQLKNYISFLGSLPLMEGSVLQRQYKDLKKAFENYYR